VCGLGLKRVGFDWILVWGVELLKLSFRWIIIWLFEGLCVGCGVGFLNSWGVCYGGSGV
jgi:hypothetical protein